MLIFCLKNEHVFSAADVHFPDRKAGLLIAFSGSELYNQNSGIFSAFGQESESDTGGYENAKTYQTEAACRIHGGDHAADAFRRTVCTAYAGQRGSRLSRR
jgi:hypothetical protein